MVKKKILPFLLIVILLLCGACFCYAAASADGVENVFSTGGVSIKLNTTANEVIDIENPKVKFMPEITNNAESCYLRVKIMANSGNNTIDLTKYIYGLDDGWEIIGDYLYLKEPMKHEEKSKLCEGFTLPEEWEYLEENNLKAFVTAEAIQEANFTPDYTSEKPWGEIAVKESFISDGYEISDARPNQDKPINVVYENAIPGVTITANNLFENIKFMPGDSYTDHITIKNDTKVGTDIYFKSTASKDTLLDILLMNIKIDNGKAFYEGNAVCEPLSKFTKMVHLRPGEEKKVQVNLAMPISADNTYQVNQSMATWYFSAIQKTEQVKTGDTFFYGFWGLLCFASAILVAVICNKGMQHENI